MKAKKRTTLFVTSWLCIAMLFVSGCSHPLVIKNLDTYRASGVESFDKPLKIGITTDAPDPEQKHLLDGIANALNGYSAHVIMPYNSKSLKEVDVVANIDIQTQHDGSGMNFFINWPGFLIWAPAWHGYIYEVKYTVNCTLTKAGTKEVIDQFTIPIALDIRHAAINRTWTEISWFEVSIIALIGGAVFINYDESVTPLVSEKVENPLGKYIALEIVKRINSSGKFSYILQNNHSPDLVKSQPRLPYPHG
jgi:hypothetical protein